MRKIILTCMLLLGASYVIQSNAQTKASFGLKLNGNMTNLKFKDAKNSNNHFDYGASFGAFTKIDFSKNFALQPELMMNYAEGKIKIGEGKLKYKYSSVEVPIYALGQFDLGSGKFFFGMGPIIGYGFDSDDAEFKIGKDIDWEDWNGWLDFSNSDKINLGLNHWYYGGAVMIGYELNRRLTFHAGYQRTHDFRSKRQNKSRIETHLISLGVGYIF